MGGIYALGEDVPEIHPDAYVHPEATVVGAVTIGAFASVWPGAVLRGDHGSITVGERTSIQDGTVLHTDERTPTYIGADCVVGHIVHAEGCHIGDGCLIGSGAVVLNRARVEAGAGVGAGALVPQDFVVSTGEIALGVPARLRPAPADLELWVKGSVQFYLDNAQRHRAELRRVG